MKKATNLQLVKMGTNPKNLLRLQRAQIYSLQYLSMIKAFVPI